MSKNSLKKRIVISLERLCAALDDIPVPYRRTDTGRLGLRPSNIGCYPLGLAVKSFELQEHWNLSPDWLDKRQKRR